MNLDELEQGLIQAARRDLGPSLADRERHQLMLSAQLREAGPDEPALSPASTGPGGARSQGLGSSGIAPTAASVSRGLRVKLLGAGLVLGVVLGGWAGFGLGRSLPAPSGVELPPEPELDLRTRPRAPAAAPAPSPVIGVDEALIAERPASP